MQCYPADAEERLGFDVIRERLGEYLRTPYGRVEREALRPSDDPEEIAARLRRAGEMQSLLALDDPLPLAAGVDVRQFLKRTVPEGAMGSAEELADAGRVLAALRQLHAFLNVRREKYPALQELRQVIVPLPAVEASIAAAIDDQGRVRDDASDELQQLTRMLSRRNEQLQGALALALRKAISQGWATEEQPTIRGGRVVIPVRAEAKRKVQGFVHDVSATGQTVYIEPAEALDLNNEIRALESERSREIVRILASVTAELRPHHESIRRSLQALGRLDLLAAIGRLANETGARVPAMNEERVLRLVGTRNPALMLHFGAEGATREVVPLSLELDDSAPTLIITGPNAGGKTVAMKTVGLISLMAQSGIPVPAEPGTSLPVFTRLFVDLGDRQSIEEDLSTFTSHLTAISRMLAEADDRSLALIDEAGTGTDPAEGGALAQAVLQRLTRQGVRTIATTHHGALKAFAHDFDGARNGSMEFDRQTLAPTYRFRSGVPGSSYAFEIARRVGLEADVVRAAKELMGAGGVALEELIAEFELRSLETKERRAEAEARLAEAEALRAQYEERLTSLQEGRDSMRKEALEEAERILREANAAIENTIREIRESQAEREATRAARKRLEVVRDAVTRQKREAMRQRPDREPPLDAMPAGPIRIGDQVRIEGSSTTGEVIRLEQNEAVVAFGSMTARSDLARLTRVGGSREQRVEIRTPQLSGTGEASSPVRTRIDVRGMRVFEALTEVARFVDAGVAAGAPALEILHGAGTGALRQAIREHLASRNDVASFESAPWNQGGDGVTYLSIG